MTDNVLKSPSKLRKMSFKALGFILLFIFTYIFLITFTIALVLGCFFLAYLLIRNNIAYYTVIPGILLIGTSVTVFIFVIKFVFKRYEQEALIKMEVTADQEPELFQLINDVAAELKSGLPWRVYLSPDDNAGVSFGSPFLSMFFPLRPNLTIGMGLINTHSLVELKGVIAHELGHCTQWGMRLGLYVHQSNKVLRNVLYDNDNFDRTLEAWADLGSFKLAAELATLFINGIQRLLKEIYKLLNFHSLALSREMEYHADSLAVRVAGSTPVINFLLRSMLSSDAFTCVYNYHVNKVNEGLRPFNIYPHQQLVMKQLAAAQRLTITNELVVVHPDMIWKLRGSKIIFINEWVTHPDVEHRVSRIKAMDTPAKNDRSTIASSILNQKEHWEELLSEKLFEQYFIYAKKPEVTSFEVFRDDFLQQFSGKVIDERYHGYYDKRLPYCEFDVELLDKEVVHTHDYYDLFNQQGFDELIESDMLGSDIALIKQMQKQPEAFNDFCYDNGSIYQADNCEELIDVLEMKMDLLDQQIKQRALYIMCYFKDLAAQSNQLEAWKQGYALFKEVIGIVLSCQDNYMDLGDKMMFMNESTPVEQIHAKMVDFKSAESLLKENLRVILSHTAFQEEITEIQRAQFETYLSLEFSYFEENRYLEDQLKQFNNLVEDFKSVYHTVCIKHKMKFLDDQLILLPAHAVA